MNLNLFYVMRRSVCGLCGDSCIKLQVRSCNLKCYIHLQGQTYMFIFLFCIGGNSTFGSLDEKYGTQVICADPKSLIFGERRCLRSTWADTLHLKGNNTLKFCLNLECQYQISISFPWAHVMCLLPLRRNKSGSC